MRFLFLTEPEATGINARWSVCESKSQQLVGAARAAGFSDREVEQSPVGTLEQDFVISATEIAKVGAVVLIGTNGSLLIELDG